ncbi:MAG: anti-sigma factor domain-containing protein, partial [Clostridiaceae bacterium]|nr:anti-sigma factor domain-containing protein [Clostridiaceae bacterium]
MNNIGTIIKIDENEAIVMCDDCIFRKVKREDNMYLGQKILVGDKDLTYRNKRINYYIGVLTSVAAVFLVLFSYFVFNQRNGIYAYVDVDINPSLRILIDGRGKVEKVDPINDDAVNIIKDLDAKGKPLKEAILSLIDVSRNQGIIDDSEVTHILICAAVNQKYKVKSKDKPLGEEGIEDLLYDIEADIDEAYNGMIQSETIRVSSKYMEISEDNDISMGKCLIYEKAKERGLGLSVEELKSERLADILEKYNFDFNDLGNLSPKVSATPENQPIPTPVPTERTAQVSEPSSTPNATVGKEPVITSASTLKPIETVTQTPIMTSKATPTEKATPTPSATPRPIPTTVKNGNGSGLRGEYYDNMDLTKFKFAKVDPVINFEWGEGSPADVIDADSYSIRWTGKVEPRYSDTYTFYTNTDDGVRLWVNGVLLIDKWQSQSATEYSGKIDLEAG